MYKGQHKQLGLLMHSFSTALSAKTSSTSVSCSTAAISTVFTRCTRKPKNGPNPLMLVLV